LKAPHSLARSRVRGALDILLFKLIKIVNDKANYAIVENIPSIPNRALSVALENKHLRKAIINGVTLKEAGREDILRLFRCGISCDTAFEPVTTPNGVSYDRSDIQNSLLRGNAFDPSNSAPLTERELKPNHTLFRLLVLYSQFDSSGSVKSSFREQYDDLKAEVKEHQEMVNDLNKRLVKIKIHLGINVLGSLSIYSFIVLSDCVNRLREFMHSNDDDPTPGILLSLGFVVTALLSAFHGIVGYNTVFLRCKGMDSKKALTVALSLFFSTAITDKSPDLVYALTMAR